MKCEKTRSFSVLLGKTLVDVRQRDDEITFFCSDGSRYRQLHVQECCENVNIEDVTGDWADLIGSPILVAEESTSRTNPEGVTKKDQDSFTWTFYKLATIKGYVDVRWYGESNGYYSESADLYEVVRS